MVVFVFFFKRVFSLKEAEAKAEEEEEKDVDATENMFTTNQRVRVTLYAQFLSK